MNREFVSKSLAAVAGSGYGTLTRIICPTTYADPRPYQWEGLAVDTQFTYTVETEGRSPDELLASFSKSLRREIRKGRDHSVEVRVGGLEAAEAVYRSTVDRYRAQGANYSMDWPYVRDLTQALAAEGRCRVYTARDSSGAFLGGVTALYSNEAAYFWQGGTKSTDLDFSVNSLIHWRIIEDLMADPPVPTVTRYDLMGANTERLCRYKSKFGGQLQPYFVVESRGRPMAWAKSIYRLFSS